MTGGLPDPVEGVGALAEPARRALYQYVAAQPDPVSREQAAAGCGLAPHSAKFHLDRLVDVGLLDVEFRRLTGRTGPGAGRPSKLYRRSAREVSVSLPERRYDLAGEVLAAAIDHSLHEGVPLPEAIVAAADAAGRQMAETTEPLGTTGAPAADELQRATEVLARHGYEPRTTDGCISLANCPFDALAREHTELVCGLNHALLGGVLDELHVDGLEAVLDPEPGLCCVKLARRSDHDR